MREGSKVVKNPFSRFSGAPAAAACVQYGGYNGLQGCCSKGDDLVAALGAVRAEEGRLGAIWMGPPLGAVPVLCGV